MAQNDAQPAEASALAELFTKAGDAPAKETGKAPAWVAQAVTQPGIGTGTEYALALALTAPGAELVTSWRAAVLAVGALTDVAHARGETFAGITASVLARVLGQAVSTSDQVLSKLTRIGALDRSPQRSTANEPLFTLPGKVLAAIG